MRLNFLRWGASNGPVFRRLACATAVYLAWSGCALGEDFVEPPPWEPAPRVGPTLTPGATKFWYAKHDRIMREAAEGDHQIIFIGDSNTDEWTVRGRATWDRLFAPLGALNMGISGDTTQNVLWRIAHGELDRLSPKVTVLLIGASDLLVPRDRGLWTAKELSRGVSAVVAAIRQKLPHTHLIILALLPAGRFPNMPIRHQADELNASLGETDFGPETEFMNLASHMLLPNGDERTELYQPDGLHLSSDGYVLEGQLLEPTVQKLLH